MCFCCDIDFCRQCAGGDLDYLALAPSHVTHLSLQESMQAAMGKCTITCTINKCNFLCHPIPIECHRSYCFSSLQDHEHPNTDGPAPFESLTRLEARLGKPVPEKCFAGQRPIYIGIACPSSPLTYIIEPLRFVRYLVIDGLDPASSRGGYWYPGTAARLSVSLP